MNTHRYLGRLVACVILACAATTGPAADNVPVAAPMTTDLAGGSGVAASVSVFRVLCPKKNASGTGFLHKSGAVITVYHLVSNCGPSDVILHGALGRINVTNIILNADLDLAILFPGREIKALVLNLSPSNQVLSIGSQVSTWGYPDGYSGVVPLLSSGYVSGIDKTKGPTGKPVMRIVVNAAFNSGNSGGPLVDIHNNTVIGVVASKLAPVPPHIESALKALKSKKSGPGLTITKPDGTKARVSQAQVVEEVLQYLRSQTQLVIGRAIRSEDVRAFLEDNGITP